MIVNVDKVKKTVILFFFFPSCCREEIRRDSCNFFKKWSFVYL